MASFNKKSYVITAKNVAYFFLKNGDFFKKKNTQLFLQERN